MSASNLKPMRITVGNERLQIQTDLSEEELFRLSSYVEKKMDTHINPELRVDPRKQFILLAMDITAELLNTQQQLQQVKQSHQEMQNSIQHLLQIFADYGEDANIPSESKNSDLKPPFL